MAGTSNVEKPASYAKLWEANLSPIKGIRSIDRQILTRPIPTAIPGVVYDLSNDHVLIDFNPLEARIALTGGLTEANLITLELNNQPFQITPEVQ
jgi:hypothetical protein